MRRSTRGKFFATWEGVDQYRDLKGGFKLRKHGRPRFWLNESDSDSGRRRVAINVNSLNDAHGWTKVRPDSLGAGTIFFDPDRSVITVAESGCMWNSLWLAPMFLDHSDVAYFGCQSPL